MTAHKTIFILIIIVAILPLSKQTYAWPFAKSDDEYIAECRNVFSEMDEETYNNIQNPLHREMVGTFLKMWPLHTAIDWIPNRRDLGMVVHPESFDDCVKYDENGYVLSRYQKKNGGETELDLILAADKPGHFIYSRNGGADKGVNFRFEFQSGNVFIKYPNDNKENLYGRIEFDKKNNLKRIIIFEYDFKYEFYFSTAGMIVKEISYYLPPETGHYVITGTGILSYDKNNNLIHQSYNYTDDGLSETAYEIKTNEHGDWVWRRQIRWADSDGERRIIIYRTDAQNNIH